MEEALIRRIMPNNLEAEQSVIGSMIMDRDAIVMASELLIRGTFIISSMGFCLKLWWNFTMKNSLWM